MPNSIRQALQQNAATLAASLNLGLEEARREVQYLLQHVLGRSRAWLIAHPEYSLDEVQQTTYQALLQRRIGGEPMAYILGAREFYGLNFRVSREVLIPRPETELLVELALERLPSARVASAHGAASGPRVLDLGTGSGAIALAIAHQRPQAHVTAVDASEGALAVARENAVISGLHHVEFVQSIWYQALEGRRYDMIVSNPPYIAAGDPHLLQGDVRFEPMQALASGIDGLDDIRHIIAGAPEHLQPGGWLLLEHGYDQSGQVCSLLRGQGFVEVHTAPDLSGIGRVSYGCLA